tara:strand:- start:250 stop:486 length:237 start_codon:yes stop_codon:yes gene_type:complete
MIGIKQLADTIDFLKAQQDLNTAQLKVLFDILKIVLENTNSDYDFSWADELFTQQYSNGVYSKNTYMEDTRKKTILNK